MEKYRDGKLEPCRSVSAAMLTGGNGNRLGGMDKQRLRCGGQCLGARIAWNLADRFRETLVVGKKGLDTYPDSAIFVPDEIPGGGPLSGLHAALGRASCEWVYLVACDMPRFSSAWLDLLLEGALASPGALAVVADSGGGRIEPFHALYSVGLRDGLESALYGALAGDERLSFARFLDSRPHARIPETAVRSITPDWALFSGINTMEDLDSLSDGFFVPEE